MIASLPRTWSKVCPLGLLILASHPAHAQGVLRALHGPDGRQLGVDMANAGDIDGDGMPDLLATCSQPSFVRIYSSADWSILLQIDDISPAGTVDRVASIGDLNGDGTRDIIISASLWSDVDLGEDGFWMGYVEARSGTDGSMLFRRQGGCSATALGIDFDVIDDVNGDGLEDVVVCEPLYSPTCSPMVSGRVLVLSGADGSLLQAIDTSFGCTSITAFDDIDGDGSPEFAVGFPGQSLVRVFNSVTGNLVYSYRGTFGSGAGVKIDASADFDEDGISDLLVGTIGRKAFLLSGVDGSQILDSGDLLGGAQDPTILGDINNDGKPDWALLGGLNPQAELSIFGGPSVERIDTLGIFGANEVDARHIEPFADVTGDGIPEFLLSNQFSNDCGPNSGSVFVMDGRCVAKRIYCEGGVNSQNQRARIATTSLTSISNNNFTLFSIGGVGSQPGLFYFGGAEASAPFGNGTRCVGSGSTGVFRLPIVTQVVGLAQYNFDLANPIGNNEDILPGSTWFFQFWYRDPLSAPGFNTSNAMEVTFCP